MSLQGFEAGSDVVTHRAEHDGARPSSSAEGVGETFLQDVVSDYDARECMYERITVLGRLIARARRSRR